MLRFDFISISGAVKTPEGWIRDRPVVARSGIQEYRRADGAIRREYRPPEEVFHADALASLHAVPVTNGHPGVVTAESPAAIIGSSLSPGIQQDGNVLAEIVIHNPKAMGPNRELSLGYRVDLDETPGEIDGQRYDAVQRNIRVNHIAVVPRGRAGNARLRLDADDAISTHEEEGPLAANLVTVRLDGGLSYEAPPEVAAALTSTREAVVTANRRADAAEAERDTLRTTVAGFDAERVQIRADAAAGVRARLELEAQASKHGVTTRADMSDRAVREAVVTKLQGDSVRFDGKSDDYVLYAFDHAVQAAATRADAAATQRATVNGAGPARMDAAPIPAIRSAQAARDAMLRRG